MSVKAQYVNYQKNNPYSNTYNHDWKDHPNFKWSNNQTLNSNQGVQQVPQAPSRKPSPLEEALANFMKSTQTSFKQVGKTQKDMFETQREMAKIQYTMSKNIKASIKNLEMQIVQLSRKVVAQR